MESFSEMQGAFSLTAAAVQGQSAARAVAEHVERAMRRADEIRPARDALAAADAKKRLGNDAFRAGDYLKAYSEYGEAHEALNVASKESTTAWEAERARLTLLANSAQCALKAGNPSGAAAFCRDALKLSACTADATMFKKVLVRLALAHDALGETDRALAVVAEAHIRGLRADEFDAINRRAKDPAPDGELPAGVEMRMFIMLALRLSAGPENLARIRGVLQSGQLPHVDRRDEVGNNVLWGVLQALGIAPEDVPEPAPDGDAHDNRGGEASVPTLALLLQAGADPRQRYDGGKTPLMYAAGSGFLSAVNAVLDAPGGVGPFDADAVNAADERGWTALHTACTAPHKKEPSSSDGGETRAHRHGASCGSTCDDGEKSSSSSSSGGPDPRAVVRALLDRGADPRTPTADGMTPLMIAAMEGNCDVVAELLREDPRRPWCGPELIRARSCGGMSAISLGQGFQPKSGVVTDLLAAAERAGGAIEAEAKEDLRAMRWLGTKDRCAAANNGVIERVRRERGAAALETALAESECERAIVGELLATCGFGDLPGGIDPSDRDAARVAMETYGDVYAALHRHVVAVAPAALTKTYGDAPDDLPTRAECGVLWHVHTLGTGKPPEANADTDPLWNTRGASEVPPLVSWNAWSGGVSHPPEAGMGKIINAMQHTFACAVPSAEALDAVAGLKTPVVEIGAGTGYWAALLEQRGVDVVALDVAPPTRLVGENAKDEAKNKFFDATFREVLRGEPADLAAHHDRALVLCWPYLRFEGRGKWDVTCLDHWKGRTLVHVGEWNAREGGDGESWPRGCASPATPEGQTTSLEFQKRVEREFRLVKCVRLPNWPFCRDDLTVWERVES